MSPTFPPSPTLPPFNPFDIAPDIDEEWDDDIRESYWEDLYNDPDYQEDDEEE